MKLEHISKQHQCIQIIIRKDNWMFLTHPFPNNSASLQNQDFSFLLGWFCGFFFLRNFIKFCKRPLQEVLICIWNMLALKKKEEVNLAQSVIIQSPPKITVSKEIVPFPQMSNLCRHNIFTTLMILILKTKQNTCFTGDSAVVYCRFLVTQISHKG